MSRVSGIRTVLTAPQALALAGSLAFAAAGCSPHVKAVVANVSASRLTDLRIVGVQDSTLVPDLAPGESVTVYARVRGEDEIVLRGRFGGRPLSPAMAAYVEPDDRARLSVDSAGAVRVRVRSPGY